MPIWRIVGNKPIADRKPPFKPKGDQGFLTTDLITECPNKADPIGEQKNAKANVERESKSSESGSPLWKNAC